MNIKQFCKHLFNTFDTDDEINGGDVIDFINNNLEPVIREAEREYTVLLAYFKRKSGKYYTSSSLEMDFGHMSEAFDYVAVLRKQGMLPGLIESPPEQRDGKSAHEDYIVHVTSDHPDNYPGLVL